jgi:hypothetical protein
MSNTPEARMATARAAADAALEQLGTAWSDYRAAARELSLSAYKAGGQKRQFDVISKHGPERFAKAIVRTMRRLKMDLVLGHARTR